jgi:hypothetical protein
MNQGRTYLIDELELSTKTASCHKADLKYYTKTRDYTDIHVVGGDLVCLCCHQMVFWIFLKHELVGRKKHEISPVCSL